MILTKGTRTVVRPSDPTWRTRRVLRVQAKTCYIDASGGDNTDGLTWATAYRTITDANMAIANPDNQFKCVQFGEGTFTPIEGEGVFYGIGDGTETYGQYLPNDFSIRGMGIGRTILRTTSKDLWSVLCLQRHNVESMTIWQDYDGTDGTMAMPIAFLAVDGASAVSCIRNVRTIGPSDGIYCSLLCASATLNVYDSIFESNWDVLRVMPSVGVSPPRSITLNSYRNRWIVEGPSPVYEDAASDSVNGNAGTHSVARAISANIGEEGNVVTINLNNDYISARNGGTGHTTGVIAGNGVTVNLRGVTISTYAPGQPNVYDIVVKDGGVATYDSSCVFDMNKVLVETGGTLTAV